MEAQFTVDPAGLAHLLQDAQARDATRAVAQAIVTDAVRTAPDGFMRYRESLHVGNTETVDGAASTPAQSSSPVWHLVEYGGARIAPRRTLTNAAQSTGVEFRETGR